MHADFRSHRVFLFADEDILANNDTLLVKCVEADYDAATYTPESARQRGKNAPQSYFGWMMMKAVSVVALWMELAYDEGLNESPLK